MEMHLCSPPKPTRTVKIEGHSALYTPAPSTPLAVAMNKYIFTPPSRPSTHATPPSLLMMRPSPVKTYPVIHMPVPQLQVPKPVGHTPALLDKNIEKAKLSLSFGSDLESALVDHALENMLSLPQVMDEVTSKGKDQTKELLKQQQVLQMSHQRLHQEQEKLEDVKGELASVCRKINLSEEQICQNDKISKQLQKDIDEMLKDNVEIDITIQKKQQEHEECSRLFEEYREKMREHVAIVKEKESQTDVHKAISKQQAKVDGLKQQKNELVANPDQAETILKGTAEEEMRKDIEALNSDEFNLEKEFKSTEEMLKKEKLQQVQLKQDTDVLHKRNAAQMTRLRRQLKEAQSRNRIWNEQATQLERNIAQLKRQQQQQH